MVQAAATRRAEASGTSFNDENSALKLCLVSFSHIALNGLEGDVSQQSQSVRSTRSFRAP